MRELHLTNDGWIPVDIPALPVCYESGTEPRQSTIGQALDTDSHKARGGSQEAITPQGAGGGENHKLPVDICGNMNTGHERSRM